MLKIEITDDEKHELYEKEDFFTTEEVCEKLNLSRGYLYDLIKKKRLPSPSKRKRKGRSLWLKKDVEALLERREILAADKDDK